MLASVVALALLETLPAKPSAAEALTEARAWVTALCADSTGVSELRKHTVFPFVQKDLGPADPRRERVCDAMKPPTESDAFDEVAKCMLESEIANPLVLKGIIAHMKPIKSRPNAWRPPYRSAVSERLKDHVFVQSKWRVDCSSYTLTLAVRRASEGPAVSLALLDAEALCE
jgi:hypothetical protein